MAVRNSTRVLLLVSMAIAVIDVLFVYINNVMATQTLQATLESEGRRLQSSFNLLLDRTFTNMLTMATFISNDEEVQSLFYQGRRAAQAEGGGAGGPRTAKIRTELLEKIGPSWQQVQKAFDVRQLHFHYGPDATSFLRVHRPERFGDDLKDVRFTLIDTFKKQTPRTGFETGRVYAGLRGVVPVMINDRQTGGKTFVGTLEVGTSFTSTLKILDQRLEQGVGILLAKDHIENTMWPDFIARRFGKIDGRCNCVIEAQSRDGLKTIVERGPQQGLNLNSDGTDIVNIDETYLIVSRFGLRDYLGNQNPDRVDVGKLVFWRDGTAQISAFRQGQYFNIAYGIAAFILIEILIISGFRFALRRLEKEVSEKTAELAEKASEMETLSITDRLTALYNRLKLDDAFEQEIRRAQRYDHPLSVILLDVDHFKSVNDTYGHQVGDQVLIKLADILRSNVRDVDIPGRWGGEEFLIICPETDETGAAQLAEKLRKAIEQYDFPVVGHKTSSFGAASRQPGESEDALMARADAALYKAKQAGRNRVEIASTEI